MKQKHEVIGWFIDWPALVDGRLGSVRDSFDDPDDWIDALRENAIDPERAGIFVRCPICGKRYEVVKCLFEDEAHLDHFHGRDSIVLDEGGCRTISRREIEGLSEVIASSMVASREPR